MPRLLTRRPRPACRAALTVPLLLLLIASPAGAATVHVELGGTDDAACGAVATPCATPKYAIDTRTATGDTVAIGSGEFSATQTIAVTKSLTISGAPSGQPPTVLDGADTTGFASQGVLRYVAAAAGTTQLVERLTFVRTGRKGTGIASATFVDPGTGAGIDFTARDLEFTGGTAPSENPFYSDNNPGRTLYQRLTTTQTRGNSVPFGRHRGPVTVEDSYLETAPSRSDYAIFAYTWSPAYAVTGAQTFRRNTIRNGSGIGVSAGFTGLAPGSFTAPVVIEDNTVRTTYGVGIVVRTIDLAGNPGVGTFTAGVRVEDNVLRGGDTATARNGITITGTVPGATITGNDVGAFARGVVLGANPQGRVPSGTVVRANQLVDNPASGARTGLAAEAGVTGTQAADNWWGCNAGPATGTAATTGDCDGIVTPTAGAVSAPTWIVLALSSDVSALAQDGGATLTGSLARNNAGAPVTGAFRDGTPLPLSATGGSLVFDSPPLIDGVGKAVFRSAGPTGRSATARFSHQLGTVTWPDVVASGPASAPTPDPVTPAAGAVPDVLPPCTREVAITDVRADGRRVTISGLARLRNAGKRVRVTYQATGGKVVSQPTVGVNGTWTTTVTRPKSPAPTSDRARYRASLGATQTSYIKISRRVTRNDITYDGSRLHIRGRVTAPLAPGARVLVTRSDLCGRYSTVGSLPVARDGTYSGTTVISPKTDQAIFARVKLRVRTSGRLPATTYSIVRPVVLSP